MKRIVMFTFSVLISLSFCLVALPGEAISGDTLFIKIATGNPAGRWYPFGARLSQLINENIKGLAEK